MAICPADVKMEPLPYLLANDVGLTGDGMSLPMVKVISA